MPGGNGMGPMGMGPMTGRGAGYCAGYGAPGYANAGMGRGFGRGGGGRGWRHWFHATGLTGWQRGGMTGWRPPAAPSDQQQAQVLGGQIEQMEQALEQMRARLKELDSQKKS